MKTLAHLSDLHFGREDAEIAAGLIVALHEAAPDLIVISGDLTQRAKKKQFRAARNFIAQLPDVPCLIVPGNHDVSTTNLYDRLVHPLKRYRRFITPELAPYLNDAEVAIAGINTVRLLSTKDGRMNRAQAELACRRLSQAAPGAIRVVVTHHPLDVPAEDTRHPTLTRARMAMSVFAGCRVDLFLSGHLHGGLTLTTSARYPMPGYSAVVAHAGTAISTRTRTEPNSWNLIRAGAGSIDVERMSWNGKKFGQAGVDRYTRQASGWALRGR